ncbi:hypothetical protein Bca101_075907 [Brassica carinata]
MSRHATSKCTTSTSTIPDMLGLGGDVSGLGKKSEVWVSWIGRSNSPLDELDEARPTRPTASWIGRSNSPLVDPTRRWRFLYALRPSFETNSYLRREFAVASYFKREISFSAISALNKFVRASVRLALRASVMRWRPYETFFGVSNFFL